MLHAHDALPRGLAISPIHAFSDNFIWCLHNQHDAVVVDPGQAEPVLEFLQQHNLRLTAILVTHHHYDHTGGISKLMSLNPGLDVIGPRGGHIRGITWSVKENDTVTLPALGLEFTTLEVPGHTLDHIAFYGHGSLFCGDTLFNGGCGRLFEGSPEQMLHSLKKFIRLPDDTRVYCAHEYTQANLAFAKAVEPDNSDLLALSSAVDDIRAHNQPSVPTDLATQRRTNPFLRADVPAVQQAANQKSDDSLTDEVTVFATIRKWKDEF